MEVNKRTIYIINEKKNMIDTQFKIIFEEIICLRDEFYILLNTRNNLFSNEIEKQLIECDFFFRSVLTEVYVLQLQEKSIELLNIHAEYLNEKIKFLKYIIKEIKEWIEIDKLPVQTLLNNLNL